MRENQFERLIVALTDISNGLAAVSNKLLEVGNTYDVRMGQQQKNINEIVWSLDSIKNLIATKDYSNEGNNHE